MTKSEKENFLTNEIKKLEISLKKREDRFLYECYNDEYCFKSRIVLEGEVVAIKAKIEYLKSEIKGI